LNNLLSFLTGNTGGWELKRKYAAEVASYGMTYMPKSMKTGYLAVENSYYRGRNRYLCEHTDTHNLSIHCESWSESQVMQKSDCMT
jgi:hypothetical protein